METSLRAEWATLFNKVYFTLLPLVGQAPLAFVGQAPLALVDLDWPQQGL